jgi:myo-inositol-1(or 4)-monophosphatase
MPEATFTDLRSLAYKLALVAAGRFDGLISRRTCHDWDVAAAQLLIAEASGRLSGIDGSALVVNRPEPHHSGLVAAGADGLHRALLQRLATG